MGFKNKVAVVTGGASGIGLACCREFAQRNASLAVVDLNEKAGRSVVKKVRQFGGKAEFFPFDVSKSASVAVGVAKIVRKLGGIDILINNAGIQRYGTATTASEEDWDLVLTVNLKSAFLMSKYVIPAMIKRGGGAIVNMGSIQSGLPKAIPCITSLASTASSDLHAAWRSITRRRTFAPIAYYLEASIRRWSAGPPP
jgi:NAD(P)-dependent dehydrogenase (short-subunit alcohol dehydrogenase family)